MIKYNPDIHNRRSIRLKGFDYTQAGWYFITICTKDRIELFSHIEDGKIILNKLGEIASSEWLKTEELRSNVELDEYVIMPNHIHGIVHIVDGDCKGTMHRTPTIPKQIEKFGKSVPNSIPTIIRHINQLYQEISIITVRLPGYQFGSETITSTSFVTNLN